MRNWRSIKVSDWVKISKIDYEDPVDREIAVMSILLDKTEDELLNMKLTDFHQLREKCEWVTTPPQVESRKRFKLMIHSRRYDIVKNVKDLTTAQYIDYQNYSKEQDMVMMLSVFIIPKGKKYGDYDLEQVVKDINDMCIIDALEILGFFQKAFLKSIRGILIYSKLKMKKMMRKARIQDKDLIRKAQEIDSLINGVG